MNLTEFREAAQELDRSTLRPASLDIRSLALRRVLGALRGPADVRDVTPEHVDAAIGRLFSEGLSRTTVCNYVGHCAHLFRRIFRDADNPFEAKALTAIPRRKREALHAIRKKAFDDEEVEQILASDSPEWFRAAVLLAWTTGLRCCEMFRSRRHQKPGLRWSAIDRRRMCIEVVGSKSVDREVPLLPAVLEALDRQRGQGAPMVFWQDGEAVDDETAARLLRKHRTRDGVMWHALRHRYALNLVRSGSPITTVRDLMGHSSIEQTEVYLQADRTVSEESVAAVARAFASV